MRDFVLSRGLMPADHGYRDGGLKYENYWPFPGYSQGLPDRISFSSSWPGSSRPSTSFVITTKEDARHKAGMTVRNRGDVTAQ
jgi:hypothetical protein